LRVRIGWKHCDGRDKPWTYSVEVWSTSHTIDDYRKRQDYTDFVSVTVAGRQSYRYRPTADTSGDKCDIVFPMARGRAHKTAADPLERAVSGER
jgi:hypothetical protein